MALIVKFINPKQQAEGEDIHESGKWVQRSGCSMCKVLHLICSTERKEGRKGKKEEKQEGNADSEGLKIV